LRFLGKRSTTELNPQPPQFGVFMGLLSMQMSGFLILVLFLASIGFVNVLAFVLSFYTVFYYYPLEAIFLLRDRKQVNPM